MPVSDMTIPRPIRAIERGDGVVSNQLRHLMNRLRSLRHLSRGNAATTDIVGLSFEITEPNPMLVEYTRYGGRTEHTVIQRIVKTCLCERLLDICSGLMVNVASAVSGAEVVILNADRKRVR
jgi:hypothetical protein